ncbi:uncharacterized protein LOC119352722 isoform X2 [Triticum dicoccoides]|uniref:uncharacterized protein LOC119352722 isoform X2 n=1 Tax=Triticum dicoccoides TaxID=85692 RepID=UPI000E7BA348|nr:uncharacterized protein LOC119352722 isoform X2 [Triticum dicoccoides]
MDDVSRAPRVLSFQLLNEITKNFSADMKVGAGSYGNVYKGEHKNGEMIAVKVLHSSLGLDNEQFAKEYENLAILQHKNIVRLVGYSHQTLGEFRHHEGRTILIETIQRALCFEYMQNGNLDGFLSDESSEHDWHTRYAIIKGICQGLKHLHEELDAPMYHLDLKPANVLLDENMVPKIADFGLSRIFGGEQTQITKSAIGTPGYVPPEYIDACIISIKFDIFSLGVVIIKIITGPKGYFRSAEMSPQAFIELVHADWKNKLQTTPAYMLEPYCKQVKRCTEIALSCVDADRRKRPSIGVIINMLNETEGNVQLVIKNKKKGPLLEHKQKVMLELTGSDYTSDRPGLDLVIVLDVSHCMSSKEMHQLKTAMRFVIQKLSHMDRLSVVTDAATRLYPLRQMTEASQQELQVLIDGLIAFGGASNIKDGLLTGLKVLAEGKVSTGRVVGIMLMSNGHMNMSDVTQVNVDNVPVYTFGVGAGCRPGVLGPIAAKSMGGTFSHIQDTGYGGLTMAFSQCLAGLLSVLAQDLELTVAPIRDVSRIMKVTAGSYPQTHDDGSVTVRFGNLYSREVRNIIVDLSLPGVDCECTAEILKVTYSYTNSSLDVMMRFVAPSEMLSVWRTSVDVSDIEEKPVELQREEVRLQAAKMIKTATACYYGGNAYAHLVQAQKLLKDQSNPLLRTELGDLLELCKTQETYDEHFRAYALSSESSHCRQRFAARGRSVEAMRLFATPLMGRYLEQAKKFHKDPMMPLPSVDDDVKEEIRNLSVNVKTRGEELQRLSFYVKN